MKFVGAIEKQLNRLYEKVPHLPKDVTTWLKTNSWWLSLALVIWVAVVVWDMVKLLRTTSELGKYYGISYATGVQDAQFTAVILIATGAAAAVFVARAITDLKAMQKRGWDNLFIAMLIFGLGNILGALVVAAAGELFFALIILAAELYLVFSIRQYFVPAESVKKKPAPSKER